MTSTFSSERIGSMVVGSLSTGTLGGNFSSTIPSSFPGITGSTSELVPHKGSIAPFEGQNDAECTANYFPRKWKGGLERDLDRRQLVFVRQPDTDKTPSSSSILNLGQLNHKLREQGTKAEAILKVYTKNPTVQKLAEIPESLWDKDEHNNLFYARDTASLAYISPHICSQMIKILGVVNQPCANEERRHNVKPSNTLSRASPINICVSKKAYVCNYWGRVSVGDKLWLVLKRVKDSITDKYAPGLRYVPEITRGTYPSLSQRIYKTRLDTMEYGICFLIGTVQAIDNVKQVQERCFREASGLLGTYDNQKSAQINSGYIKIQLYSGVGMGFI